MQRISKFLTNKTSVDLGMILCFLLPPVGMLLLFFIGWNSLHLKWKAEKKIMFSLGTIFFACLFVSTIGAAIQMKDGSFLLISAMILGYWGLYLHVMSTGTEQVFRRFRWIMIFGGVYCYYISFFSRWTAAHPVIGYLTGTILFGDSTSKGYSRLIGSAYNPNFTVYLLLMGIAFLLAEMLVSLRKKQFLFLFWQLPILMILSKAVIETGSRAGFAAMICIGMLFCLRLHKGIFALGLIFAMTQYERVYHWMPRNNLVSQSTAVRQTIWKNSILLWEKHPIFGMTPLGFHKEYIHYMNQMIPHAHNIGIGFITEYGALGGIAFLILLFASVCKSSYLFFDRKKHRRLLEYFLLSLPVIVLTGVFDHPLNSPQLGLLTIILLASWEKYTGRIPLLQPMLVFLKRKLNPSIFDPKEKPSSSLSFKKKGL